jgi:acyl carrier protein
MTRGDVEQIVLEAMAAANLGREPAQALTVAPGAPLFGPGSPLDSLGLVGLIVDIEDALRDRGAEAELSSAAAMSRARSPFRDVGSLVDHIMALVAARP